jgi:hypothetical protein
MVTSVAFQPIFRAWDPTKGVLLMARATIAFSDLLELKAKVTLQLVDKTQVQVSKMQ